MLGAVDSARRIENLLYTYAERIDAGDFEGVAALFEHATLHAAADGPPIATGRDEVLALYTSSTRRYPDDGTPKTRHLTSNAIIEVDDAAGTATCRSSYCVVQATPDLPLQPIVVGRYHDTFALIDGVWAFARRVIFLDLTGDLSQHLLW